MQISGDYPQPVQVNGFTCHNCTEVDLAKKHIDPAHPKSGPFNIDAASDPTRSPAAKPADAPASSAAGGPQPAGAPGQVLNLLV
jgi:hypothetical protein